MWRNGQKKYEGWFKRHDENTNLSQATAANMSTFIAGLPDLPKDRNELNYYRSWHWFFRWMMAGRTIEEIRTYMWDVTRMRLQDILDLRVNVAAVSSGPSWNNTYGHVLINNGINNVALSEIFTSEVAVAGLLRGHVNAPTSVVRTNNEVGRKVCETIASAITQNNSLIWNTGINGWGNAHEIALINRLFPMLEAQNDSLRTTMRHVKYWRNPGPYPANYHGTLTNPPNNIDVSPNFYVRNQLGPLNPNRGSFTFDDTGI